MDDGGGHASILGLRLAKHPLLPVCAAAALVPVLAGYNQTARHCARLGLSGEAAEEVGAAKDASAGTSHRRHTGLACLSLLWLVQHVASQQAAACLGIYSHVCCHGNRLQLWRKQHKWAARRTAALLPDLPDTVSWC